MKRWFVIPALAGLFCAAAAAAQAPPARPFSEAVRVGDVLYLSGQIGAGPEGRVVPGGLPEETRRAMDNIGAVLQRNGLGFTDVFKCTVMLTDMSRWADFNRIYVGYFTPGRLPARSAIGAAALALGAQVEVECLARFDGGAIPARTSGGGAPR